MDDLDLIFLIIPTGAFFGHHSMPSGICISKNESVNTLYTKIRKRYSYDYGDASFNLRVVDIERREYVYMEPEKKIGDYFNESLVKLREIAIHIL
ncbi:9344_t:CDS:1, partial [Acaulospora morrowiae]